MIPTVRIIKSSSDRVYLVKNTDTGRIMHRVLSATEAIKLVDDLGYVLQPDYEVATPTTIRLKGNYRGEFTI